jgi:Tfp pilus assembly ATPase PilU
MNQALLSLFQRRIISLEDAFAHSGDVDELRSMMDRR